MVRLVIEFTSVSSVTLQVKGGCRAQLATQAKFQGSRPPVRSWADVETRLPGLHPRSQFAEHPPHRQRLGQASAASISAGPNLARPNSRLSLSIRSSILSA